MGTVPNVSYNTFPKQRLGMLGKAVRVCYMHDTSKQHSGKFVRADAEPPWVDIIRLENGNFVLATECQYQPVR
jgi:hypothetical protein